MLMLHVQDMDGSQNVSNARYGFAIVIGTNFYPSHFVPKSFRTQVGRFIPKGLVVSCPMS